MAKTTVLYLITKGSPFGGAQKYVYTLATELPSEHFEPIVVVGAGDDLRDKLDDRGIRVITLGEMQRDIQLIRELKTFCQLVKLIRTISPDVLHLNSTKAGGVGALAGRLCRVKKIIYTVHGWPFNEKRHFMSTFAIRLLSWITVLLCHTVIVIARSEERIALRMPLTNNDKIKLIHNGIPPIDFKERQASRDFLVARMGRAPEPHALWIGTVAELHRNKNIKAAVEALRNIAVRYVYVVIGEGEERTALEEQVRAGNLADKVFLAGKIDDAAIYLKAFDIFTLPSLKEGLPYALLEAGLAGLPCLSSPVGGIPEIIRDHVSGVLTHPVAHEIRSGLEFLINHPGERSEFGAAIMKTVTKDFSLQQMVRRTLDIYSPLAPGKSTVGPEGAERTP